jgi:hypothetical protein
MNIEKINKFLDYIYDEKSMCWYGENLEEEFEPEILENTEAEIKAKDDEEWDAYKKSITRRAS